MKQRRYKYLPLWLTLAFYLIILSSCGSFKKNLHTSKEKTHVKTDEVIKTKTDSTSALTTVTTRTITEGFNTNFEVKADSASGEKTIEELLHGKTITEENNGVVIDVSYDTITKKIKGVAKRKKQVIPVQGEKKTIEAITQDQWTHLSKVVDNQKHTDSLRVIKDKVVAKEMKSGINWTLIIILILAAAFCYWKFFK